MRSSNHNEGQRLSEFVYRHMPHVDGFLYSSRFTDAVCVAIYRRRRTVEKLVSDAMPQALTKPLLTHVLGPWNINVT